jgi:hypothetical protein
MLVEHAFEERDGIAEGVIQSDQEVDVVKIVTERLKTSHV